MAKTDKQDFASLVRSFLPKGTKLKADDWSLVKDLATTQRRLKKVTVVEGRRCGSSTY